MIAELLRLQPNRSHPDSSYSGVLASPDGIRMGFSHLSNRGYSVQAVLSTQICV